MIRKLLRLLVCMGICLILGCPKSEEEVPSTSFRIIANKLVDEKDLFVQKISIEALGERTIQVNAEDQYFRRSDVRPDQITNILHYELLFVGALMDRSDSSRMFKWFIQYKEPNSTTYHRKILEVGARDILSDVLRMDLSDGSYPYNKQLVLGDFLKDQIVLLVK